MLEPKYKDALRDFFWDNQEELTNGFIEKMRHELAAFGAEWIDRYPDACDALGPVGVMEVVQEEYMKNNEALFKSFVEYEFYKECSDKGDRHADDA